MGVLGFESGRGIGYSSVSGEEEEEEEEGGKGKREGDRKERSKGGRVRKVKMRLRSGARSGVRWWRSEGVNGVRRDVRVAVWGV